MGFLRLILYFFSFRHTEHKQISLTQVLCTFLFVRYLFTSLPSAQQLIYVYVSFQTQVLQSCIVNLCWTDYSPSTVITRLKGVSLAFFTF